MVTTMTLSCLFLVHVAVYDHACPFTPSHQAPCLPSVTFSESCYSPRRHPMLARYSPSVLGDRLTGEACLSVRLFAPIYQPRPPPLLLMLKVFHIEDSRCVRNSTDQWFTLAFCTIIRSVVHLFTHLYDWPALKRVRLSVCLSICHTMVLYPDE